jgi:hypothetical protein
VAEGAQWWIGDWAVAGEKLFGDGPGRQAEAHKRYVRLMQETGYHLSTLKNFALVARAIPASRRHDALSWSHHYEVVTRVDGRKEQERFLKAAEKNEWSVAMLRQAIFVQSMPARPAILDAEVVSTSKDIEHAGGAPRVGLDSWKEESYAVPIHQVQEELSSETADEDEVWALASRAFIRLIKWIHLADEKNGRSISVAKPNGVMIRAYVAAQLCCPEIFGGVTDVELCQRIGVLKQAFGEDKSNFRDRFKFVTLNMRSQRGCDNMAAAYKRRRSKAA